jgi:integrase
MATASLRIKTDSKENSIYLRFKQGKLFDLEASTGIKVPKGKWSFKMEKINPTDEVDWNELNPKLSALKEFVNNQYSSDSIKGVIINNQWLKKNINSFLNKKTNDDKIDEQRYLRTFIQSFIDNAEKRLTNPKNPIKPRTIQHYQTTKNKIEAYEEYSGKSLNLVDVSLQFHTAFIEFLEVEQLLNPNTIGGYIDVLKQVCNKAELKGYIVNSDYKNSDFYTPSNKTQDTYLKLEEIHTIYNYKFDTDYLDNARDWLIISVWTGLRVSDLLSLNKSNIDGEYIKKDTLKTNYPVIIPIHTQVREILKKRGGKFPRKISDQKYNEYIKKVCLDAGITEYISGSKLSPIMIKKNGKKEKIHRKVKGKYQKCELVSSHIGRRSFASNHYGKLDTLTLMKITGHKTEAQFLDYIKVTPKEYALKLKEYWAKINIEEFVNS